MTNAFFFTVAVLWFAIPSVAQDTTTQLYPDVQRFSAGFHTGPIFAHSENVQNTSGAHPKGIELLWSWQRNNASAWSLCACSPIQGFQLSYYDFDTRILGRGINAAYLLEPMYHLSTRMRASFRTAVGLAYLTNPYDEVFNPANQSYSTAINVYLSLGFGLEYQVTRRWSVEAVGQYQHISNGGIAYPNKGINWPTIGLLTTYRPKPRPLQKFERTDIGQRNNARWDVVLYAMGKRVGGQPDGKSKRFFLMGASAQAAWQVGRINNLTAGAELVWDGALKYRQTNEGTTIDPWRLGVLAGHEFILGKFLFSQRVGIYLHQAGDYDQWYHSWGLVYRINKHWGTGINLRAHKQVADYSDLRLVYSF
jgi:hypothetical protein